MGVVFGKINFERPAYTVLRTAADGAYEVRRYGQSIAAEVRSADWAEELTVDEFSTVGFRTLARYIGVFTTPQNVAAGGGAGGAGEKVAMTAPVVMGGGKPERVAITSPVVMGGGKPERVAMTSPVVMGGGKPERVAMTSPVVMGGDGTAGGDGPVDSDGGGYTMRFLLPAKYAAVSDAPVPTDSKVHLTTVAPHTVGVRRYSGNSSLATCGDEVKALHAALARDGVNTTGRWTFQGYNPPFCLPSAKTNEIHVPVDVAA